MLVYEDGPLDVLVKLRTLLGVRYDEFSVPYGNNVVASALTCLWCTSVWIGAIIAIVNKPVYLRTFLQRALALSASAIMIDEIVHNKQ